MDSGVRDWLRRCWCRLMGRLEHGPHGHWMPNVRHAVYHKDRWGQWHCDEWYCHCCNVGPGVNSQEPAA